MKKAKGTKDSSIFNNRDNNTTVKNKSLSYYNLTNREAPIKIFPHADFPLSAFFHKSKR